MARLLPSDVSELSLSLGETAELRTLEILRRELPQDYTVFHSVHWSQDAARGTAFGEADFIIVNRSGETLVVEQKSGQLEETSDGLIKEYRDGRKNVAAQIHRTLDAIRRQFKQQSGRGIILDYLIYCPDYQVRDLNAVGFAPSRIVDARDKGGLGSRVVACLGPGSDSEQGGRVLRFFQNRFHLVPDIHAHVVAGEQAMVRLSGGLIETLSSIEMKPLRLCVHGTAGCGKSSVAARFAAAALEVGKRPLLICFNRPLAERLRVTAPQGTKVDTFYGFLDHFLKSCGQKLAYDRIGVKGFWQEVQERVIGEAVPDDWRFDTLIVDEGQDFTPDWADILRLFLKDDADVLWLEDPDQSIRRELGHQADPAEPAHLRLGDGFVGYRARYNYRSPETIARYILRVLPFEFKPANPLPGLGVGVSTYKSPEQQGKRVSAIVTDLVRRGFRHSDIVVLSMRGLATATLAHEARVGAFTLARPTGAYDLFGNQVLEPGQLRFDTVYRFKGQQAPAVILTDMDPHPTKLDHFNRLLFSAMTRATARLEIVAREGNPVVEGLFT